MSLPKIEVEIRPTNKLGAIKAHADVRILLVNGEIHLMGFAIIEQPGKKPFIGFPQNRGRNRYFPVVVAKGEIQEEIVKAIFRAHEDNEGERE